MLTGTFRIAFSAIALGMAGFAACGDSAAAEAHETYRTNCIENDCVRFLCNEVGQDCFLLGYFDRREDIRPARSEYGTGPDLSRADDNGDYGNPGPHYHYKNHFDPDNDFDEYPN